MKKLWQVAIVGPGWVAGAYCASFRKRDDVAVCHVVGRTAERAREFADRLGLDCPAHTRLSRALADPAVDIVAILTPHHLHARQAIAAANARKHLIIEKPVCLSLRELRAIQAAVRRAKVSSIVGFVLRWNPLLKIIRRHITDGALGDIFYLEADYLHGIVGKPYTKPWHTKRRTAGTSLLVGGCHAVDAMRFLMDKPAVEVSAYATSRTKGLQYESTQVALVKFADGSLGKVASCLECQMPYVFNVEVYGTKGSFRRNEFSTEALTGQTGFATVPAVAPDSADVSGHPFDDEVDHFIDCLNRRRRPMPDLEDAAATHEIIFAADLSARRRKPVRLPLPR